MVGVTQALVQPAVPRRGRPSGDLRRQLEGMLAVMHTGGPWREGPSACGPWQTIYAHDALWLRTGRWGRIAAILHPGLSEPEPAAPPYTSNCRCSVFGIVEYRTTVVQSGCLRTISRRGPLVAVLRLACCHDIPIAPYQLGERPGGFVRTLTSAHTTLEEAAAATSTGPSPAELARLYGALTSAHLRMIA